MNDCCGSGCACDAASVWGPGTRTPPLCRNSCFLRWLLSVAMTLSASGVLAAQDELARLQLQVQMLREQMSQMQRRYETQIDSLEHRILEIETATEFHQGHTGPVPKAGDAEQVDLQHKALPWSMSGLLSTGGSSADADGLEQLQAGTHDPRNNGFTLQALALAVHAELDHGLEATVSIVSHIEPDGENVVELEQAFLHAGDLAPGLLAMAGQYFLAFGQENERHPDEMDFVDTPFLISRLFGGDKLRSQGVQLAWQPPLPWQSSMLLGASNPVGETVSSFLSEAGEEVAGHVLQDRDVEALDDLLYLLRWSHHWPVNRSNSLGFGISALFGPNASGSATDTQIYGVDLQWSWHDAAHREPALFNWRTEIMYRRYEAGDQEDPTREILEDYGLFSQAVWRLHDKWWAGLRAEFADGNSGSTDDPLRDNRKRLSLNLTHPLGESTRVRLQYNHDRAEHLLGGSADSVWLQLLFQAGAHHEHL